MKRVAGMISVLVLFSTAAWAGDELSGRDFVERGAIAEIAGNLSQEDGEWYLETDGKTYAVHLGNHEILYPDGLTLKAGDSAQVQGYIYGTDIAAIRVISGGMDYAFRSEAGDPLWAGRGRRRNAVESRGERGTAASRAASI